MPSGDVPSAADVRLEAVRFAVPDPAATAAFWAALLDREMRAEPEGALLPGDPTQVGLRFVRAAAGPPAPPWLHLHVTSADDADQRRTVDTALRLGARRRDAGHEDPRGFVVLDDPSGAGFCVMEPGNAYLAGTGRLGEVTCDGSRAVGLFWRDALGWPLVWDEGDQTGVQAPPGGTKLSWDRWSGESLRSGHAPRFDLRSVDPAAAAGHLLALGATARADGGLADPDGTPFGLLPG